MITRRRAAISEFRISQQTIVFTLFLLMFAGFALFVPGFSKADNVLGMLQNVSILGILGLAMAVVVIGRGIDISLIAIMAIPAGLALQMGQSGHPVWECFSAGLLLALACGLVNGWLTAYAEVPSLFTTLASGLFLAGLGQVAFFSIDVVLWSPRLDSMAWVGRGTFLGVPAPVVMFGLVALCVSWFLRRTRPGRYIYAIGDNPLAARATGIPTRPVIMLQYLLAALIAVIAGWVMAASISSMPTRVFNSTLIYDVILVVVLGGIGLSGGRGGVLNVVVGTLLIGTLLNGMTILDVPYTSQNFIRGILLLLAILLDSFLNPRNEETAQQGDI